MYNVWWLVIAFGIATILSCVPAIVIAGISNYYYKKKEGCWNKRINLPYYSDKYKELDEKENLYKQKWEKMPNPAWMFIVSVVLAFCLLITILIASINTVCTKNEYAEFIETQRLVQEVYNGDYGEYENVGLNNKIIELNQWLAQAKASKKQWGNWSPYCIVDVDSLDYIVLVKGDTLNGRNENE